MKRKTLLILFGVVIVIAVGLVFLHQFGLHTFGPFYDPDNSRDLQKLTTIANDSRQLRDALEQFTRDHGRYPPSATNLFPAYLHATNSPGDFSDWKGWRYVEAATNTYTLLFQVNWEDGLWYEQSAVGTGQWHYSTSGESTDLTKKFE